MTVSLRGWPVNLQSSTKQVGEVTFTSISFSPMISMPTKLRPSLIRWGFRVFIIVWSWGVISAGFVVPPAKILFL